MKYVVTRGKSVDEAVTAAEAHEVEETSIRITEQAR